jgi:hypothetical protein
MIVFRRDELDRVPTKIVKAILVDATLAFLFKRTLSKPQSNYTVREDST